MSDLLLDIITYLKGQGLVTDDGVDAFRDFTPSEPNDVVILNEGGGTPIFPSEVANRSVQIMVRGQDPQTVKDKAWSIYNVFDPEDPESCIIDLTDTRWAIIAVRQAPFKVGVDDSNRVLWTFNIGVLTHRD